MRLKQHLQRKHQAAIFPESTPKDSNRNNEDNKEVLVCTSNLNRNIHYKKIQSFICKIIAARQPANLLKTMSLLYCVIMTALSFPYWSAELVIPVSFFNPIFCFT